MSYLISDTDWANYKDIIDGINEDFGQDPIIWKKSKGGIDRNGEDNNTERFTSITLKGLFQYNNTRIWPLTKFTESGAIDEQSQVIIFNISYLNDLGYINADGTFAYNQTADRFVHRGITYMAVGDTLISQAKDEPLHFMIILSRITIPSGKDNV